MTLVIMRQDEFDTLSDERLGWACVEATLVGIQGKSPEAKSQALSRLNRSQQALCMFRVFYDHAKNSASEYYAWVSYLLQAPGYWPGVLGGIRYFGDDDMLRLLEDTKQVIEERNDRLQLQADQASLKDLEHDQDLAQAVNRLYETFQEIVPHSLNIISSYIRSNPQDFVMIDED